jgi:hypothetical protein
LVRIDEVPDGLAKVIQVLMGPVQFQLERLGSRHARILSPEELPRLANPLRLNHASDEGCDT